MPKGVYQRKSEEERFAEKTCVKGENECWEWMASKTVDGYGYFTSNKKTVQAHRFSYKLANPNDEITNFIIRHTCDNRECVNPKHLIKGTPAENSQDMKDRGRQAKGDTNGASKLTEEEAKAIIAEYNSDKKNGKLYGLHIRLAEKYKVDKQIISRLTAGKTWTHLDR